MARPANRVAALTLAIAAAWAAAPALGQGLGTLFHTPKERAELERLRRGEPAAGRGPGQPGQRTYVRPDPVVTGYVKRSDGKSTVFIDEQPYPVRNEKLQGLLEPRAVQKYVPPPPPPVEVPAATPPAPGPSDTPASRSGNRPRT